MMPASTAIPLIVYGIFLVVGMYTAVNTILLAVHRDTRGIHCITILIATLYVATASLYPFLYNARDRTLVKYATVPKHVMNDTYAIATEDQQTIAYLLTGMHFDNQAVDVEIVTEHKLMTSIQHDPIIKVNGQPVNKLTIYSIPQQAN